MSKTKMALSGLLLIILGTPGFAKVLFCSGEGEVRGLISIVLILAGCGFLGRVCALYSSDTEDSPDV